MRKIKNPFEKYAKAFSKNTFWKRMQEIAKNVGQKTVYMVLLMYYSFIRKETPHWAKNIIIGVIGYLLTPFDAVPDLTPIIGYTDDIGVLTFGLVTIACYVNQEVRKQAREKLEQWFGEVDEAQIEEVNKQL
jgi:uncharacterized membrane protein YkvA (DUF1232 family)